MSGETRAKPIRGPQRIALVLDLASGELTHEALATKYGRTKQAIHEFSAYNSAEIQAQRDTLAEALSDELRGVLIANKANRIKWLDQYHRDCEEDLETATDPRERRQLRAQAAKLMHQAAEQLAQIIHD